MADAASYRIPCAGGDFTWTTDFTKRLNRRRDLLMRLRPFPESFERYETMAGWRANVEGTWSTIKSRLPNRRATAWTMERLGVHLWAPPSPSTPIAWDVHAGRNSRVARHEYDRLDRQTQAA